MDWLEMLPQPDGDEPLDDSWAAFMADKRMKAETMRSKQRAVQRREARWQKRGQVAPADHVDSRTAVQRDFEAHCDQNGWPSSAAEAAFDRRIFVMNRRKQSERERLSKITEQRRAARDAAGLGGRKRGRPVNPESVRRREERQACQQKRREAREAREAREPAAQTTPALMGDHDAERAEARARRAAEQIEVRQRRDALRLAVHAARVLERTTEGQCEGWTRNGERCKVHMSSAYAVAAPLRALL